MGTDQVIYIRTDGNTDIATGHIMRCLTIADACRKKGASVVFVVSDEESEALLTARMGGDAYPIMNLRTDYRDTDEELPLFCQLLMSYPCSVLLIDSYFVTPGYLDTLSRLTHVAYLDDLYAFPYPVQTVINYDIDADPASECYSLASRKLLGPGYAPLREMFVQRSYCVRPEIKNILLTAGGMNDGRYFIKLIRAVDRHFGHADSDPDAPTIHLLMSSSDIAPELSAILEKRPDITLHEYVSDMAGFLCGFDLVFSASGTTLYEVCALGIPCISFIIADNQIPSAMAFARAGLVPCIGDLRTDGEREPDAPRGEALQLDTDCTGSPDALLTSYADHEMRCKCSARMTAAIDKKGAGRIADALTEL